MRNREQLTAAMVAQRYEGKTYQEIADNFGFTRQRVHQIIGAHLPPVPKSAEDISRRKFGHLRVIEYVYSQHGHAYWLCACDCGVTKPVSALQLKRGRTVSCGCHRADPAVRRASHAYRPPTDPQLLLVWQRARESGCVCRLTRDSKALLINGRHVAVRLTAREYAGESTAVVRYARFRVGELSGESHIAFVVALPDTDPRIYVVPVKELKPNSTIYIPVLEPAYQRKENRTSTRWLAFEEQWPNAN